MENAYSNDETKKFYWEVNSVRKGFKPQTLMIKDKGGNIARNKKEVLQIWSEYYEKYFQLQGGRDSDSREEWKMCVQSAEPSVEPPNDVDIEMAISNFKSGQATGHDQLPAELIKEGGKELKKGICERI